jgi:hypothetical protein
MPAIELIWDFFGPRAQGIAEHHAAHVNEFVRREGVTAEVGVRPSGPGHWSARVLVSEEDALPLRKVLRPSRAVPLEHDSGSD